MRIVVTGALGFLGQAVLEQLMTHPDIEAVGIARRAAPNVHMVSSYDDTPVGDVLIHLAECSDRKLVNNGGVLYEQSVIHTLARLLVKGFPRIIYASSAVLYDDAHLRPLREDDDIKIVDSYTHGKHFCENRVLEHDGVVARLSNLFGTGMSKNNVINTIFNQLDGNGDVWVLDTTPIRDFLWVEDAATALCCMAIGSSSGIFNVGSGSATSIAQLGQVILEITGQSERQILSVQKSSHFSKIVLDITKIKQFFDWQPKTNLRQGIRRSLTQNIKG